MECPKQHDPHKLQKKDCYCNHKAPPSALNGVYREKLKPNKNKTVKNSDLFKTKKGKEKKVKYRVWGKTGYETIIKKYTTDWKH